MDNNQLDFITIVSLVLTLYALYIGLENLQENRVQSKSQEDLLKYLESHLSNQDEHLKSQDELIKNIREENKQGKSG